MYGWTVEGLWRFLRKEIQKDCRVWWMPLFGNLHRIAELLDPRACQPYPATNGAASRGVPEESTQRQFNSRVHFLAIASRAMRQVLVDYARARAAEKRSGRKRADAFKGKLRHDTVDSRFGQSKLCPNY